MLQFETREPVETVASLTFPPLCNPIQWCCSDTLPKMLKDKAKERAAGFKPNTFTAITDAKDPWLRNFRMQCAFRAEYVVAMVLRAHGHVRLHDDRKGSCDLWWRPKGSEQYLRVEVKSKNFTADRFPHHVPRYNRVWDDKDKRPQIFVFCVMRGRDIGLVGWVTFEQLVERGVMKTAGTREGGYTHKYDSTEINCCDLNSIWGMS